MALPELYQEKEYQRQTFDRNSEFAKRNPNLTARGTRKFNRYWNSDQRLADEKAFNEKEDAAEAAFVQGEIDKRAASWDARIAALREQNKARGEAALKNINASLAAKPAVPVSKPDPTPVPKTLTPRSEAEWNRIANEATNGQLKTMADVEAWQRANGFSEDQIDGKFGDYSKSYFETNKLGNYQIAPVEENNSNIPSGYVELSRPDGTTFLQKINSTSTNTSETSTPFDLMGYAMQNGLNKFYNHGGKRYVRYDPFGIGDFLIGEDGEMYHAGRWGSLGKKVSNSSVGIEGSDHYNNYQKVLGTLNSFKGVTSNKQGGTMNRINYFQQGGAAPQQQDMQAQVVALVQAAMQGDQKATQTVNQIMEAAKAGDQQAIQIAQLMEQVIKQMQGQATTAKYGAKLNYLQSLKCGGKSMKKKEQGGKVCPECEKTAVNKKNLITKHSNGKTLDYAKATRFYNNWSEADIRKLKIGLAGYADYDGDVDSGKVDKAMIDAVARLQGEKQVTSDGMWGHNSNTQIQLVSASTADKGSYKKTWGTEQGSLVALPTNFTYTKLSDLSNKDAQAVIDYYSAYPELLYSDDPEHAKWRQVFHNSGQAGADFLNQSFGAMSVADRAAVDPKKTTKSHKIAEINNAVTEGTNRAAAQLLPALTLPFAIGGVTSALAGGAGLAGYAGLAGSIGGSAGGAVAGKAIGRRIGKKNADKTYVDDVAARYGVGSSVIDPERRIREGEERGERIGGITGGILGGALSGLLGAKAQAKYYNTAGKGRAKTNAKAAIEEEADVSLQPMGYTKPGKVKGDSTLKLFFKGLKQSVQSGEGQTRAGGPPGLKIRYKGKTYNPGNYASDEVLQAGKALYETPDSPITVVLGGKKNLGTGVKLSAAYKTNAVPAMNAGLMTTPAVMVTEDAVSDTQPNHPVRQQRRADRKEERKERRQERHRKLIARTAESTTD